MSRSNTVTFDLPADQFERVKAFGRELGLTTRSGRVNMSAAIRRAIMVGISPTTGASRASHKAEEATIARE